MKTPTTHTILRLRTMSPFFLLIALLIGACEFESRTDQEYGPVGPGTPVDTSGTGGVDTTGNGGSDTNDTSGSPVTLTINPPSASIKTGETIQLSATVTGSTDGRVAWEVLTGPGTIDATGLYTAPTTITGTLVLVTVRGSAVVDPAIFRTSTIAVTPGDAGNGGGGGGGGGGDTATGQEICFERDILPIFQSNCTQSGCHDAQSAQEGYVFTTYEGISRGVRAGRPDNSEAYEKITEDRLDKRMPPPPETPLSSAQISMIRQWIVEGARNTICPPDNSLGCDTVNVSYSSTIRPILEKYCVGCHSGSNPPNGINLTLFADVRRVALDGRLPGAVSHAPGFTPMPYNGNRLPACEIAKIRSWARDGAQEN